MVEVAVTSFNIWFLRDATIFWRLYPMVSMASTILGVETLGSVSVEEADEPYSL